jgi:hypothetical protein
MSAAIIRFIGLFSLSERVASPSEDPYLVNFLTYRGLTLNHIGNALLAGCQFGQPPAKEISNFLQSAKDNLGLKTWGVYSIPFKCVQVYIDKTDSLIDIRVKEHL